VSTDCYEKKAEALDAGVPVFWDADAQQVTAIPGAGPRVGRVAADAAIGDATVMVTADV
jgi:predicted RecA/RadA family phage recombinase